MFDDDAKPNLFERALDQVYGDDEHGKAAARADITAMHDHNTTDASRAYELIARGVWAALRDLGISGGRMLTIGQDAETFAGVPVFERRMDPGALSRLAATIPKRPGLPGQAPHPGILLRTWDRNVDHDRFDVVIAVPAYTDVALHRPGVGSDRRIEQILGIIGCLANTEPGGYTIALVSRDVLDDSDVEGRRLLTELGELVGALRLPSGALRENPGNDAVVDLLIMRRHFGAPIRSHTFLPTSVQLVRGQEVRINQYFRANPSHVLGRLDARPSVWGSSELVVHSTGLGLDRDLTAGLAKVTDHARAAGLTANTDHCLDADVSIDNTLARRDDMDAVRRRIRNLRVSKHQRAESGKSSPDPPSQPPGPGGEARPDLPGPGF
ncbi:hypothetical protein GCM10027063_39340 [Promicromonospora xylanilytica]